MGSPSHHVRENRFKERFRGHRLSADQQLRLCKNVAASLGHRCSELDSVALVGALQAAAADISISNHLMHFAF
jgi:epoxyqueuosine reductase QueG